MSIFVSQENILFVNLSFGFSRYENGQGLEANFTDLFAGNSQLAIFKNKAAKFTREIVHFQARKPKTQVP